MPTTLQADFVRLNKRRRFRFSLRSLLLVLLRAAVGALVGAMLATLLQNSQAIGQDAPERLRDLQQRIINAADKAKSSVVRVVWRYHGRYREVDDCASGVILSTDGYIATYLYKSYGRERTRIPPGTSVSVTLADERRVPGVAIGSYSSQKHLHFDLVKISENGVWPCAELRHTGAPKAGETCLALGFGREPGIHPRRAMEREARVRIGHLIPWGVSGMLRSSCVINGIDDRGGGLFDLDGRLIGIHLFQPFADKALTQPTTCHLDISIVERKWRSLADQKSTAGESMPGQFTPTSEALRHATVQTVPSPDAPELAKIAGKAREVSVALTRKDVLLGFSGTIITPDGYIATCAHHKLPRGTGTTVYFGDGRTATANLLGRDDVLDIGLAKISGPGPWPFAPLGSTAGVKAGDPCIIAGYPNYLRKQGKTSLVVRGARIAGTGYAPTETRSFCQVWDGDSGGGLFDREGRLIGVLIGPDKPNDVLAAHAGADGFAALWKSLVDGRALSDSSVFDESPAAATMGKFVQSFSPIACEVFRDGKRCALGTIITTDGFVLTKASELFGTISCRLATGRELAADVHGVAHQHDLALLKIDVTGLRQIDWDERDENPVGTLVAALRGVEPPVIGIVSTARHEVASAIGYLPIGKVRAADGGIRVDEVESWWNSVVEDVPRRRQLEKPETPVRVGDVILSIEGRPVPTVNAFEQLVTRRDDGPGWEVPFVIGGDPICVTLRRHEKERRLRFPLVSSNWEPRLKTNRRSCSFPVVFDTDVRLTKGLCGGPLVNCEGRVIGITIAVPEGVLTDSPVATRVYAVPAALARAVADQLK